MDKIEKIRQEIKRLKSTNPSEYNYQNAEGYTWALDDLLSFIDNLEEPDKSLEEAANEFCKTIFHKPFSENPQEEQIVYDGDRYVGFIAGVKWQSEHTPLPEDTVIFQKGVEEGKRLLMEEAVEGSIRSFGLRNAICIKDPKWTEKLDKYKDGDKVLVLLLPKED